MVATFMPKPFADRTGSGLHLHLSLTSGGAPSFPGEEDERGLGLSPTAYAFIGGILDHACALQAVIAPTVNSYKRTGATTHGVRRIVGAAHTDLRRQRPHPLHPRPRPQRIELRGSDGSANPYLAIAAALGAGIDGIKRSADPGAVGAVRRPVVAAADAAARGRRTRGRPGRRRRARRRRRRGGRLLRRTSSARSSSPTTARSSRGRSTST